MSNQVNTYLKYANLQMAAEALYDINPASDPTPGEYRSGEVDVRVLTHGNDHTSKFTQTMADDFSKKWKARVGWAE